MAHLVFLGSPEAAVVSLRSLVDAGHEVDLVVSQPDRRRGRGGARSPSPVKEAALQMGLAVSEQLDDALWPGADLGVVVAYGRIVPQRVLDASAMVNVHFSLLPRWRGPSPVERAIMAGDRETGACVMRLEAGLDTGPVLALQRVEIGSDPPEHARELTGRLSEIGARLLVAALAGGVESLGAGSPQVGEPSYAGKLDPSELCLDWSHPATHIERVVRLDRAWTTFRGARLRILQARAVSLDGRSAGRATTGRSTVRDQAPEEGGGSLQADGLAPGAVLAVAGRVLAGTGTGRLLVEEVQPEGRRPMRAETWAHGARLASNELLGTSL